jgi:hypothetical protein
MNINDLREMCQKDTKINSMDIDGYSLSIPELSNKYHQIAFDERKTLRFLEAQYNIIKREKWLYYTGKANNDVYDKTPFDLKVLAKDIDLFLSSDKMIIDIKEKIEEQRDKIKIIEDTAKIIQNASFNINNTIKWKKFLSGDLT